MFFQFWQVSEVDTTQYTLSSYGSLELSDKGSIEAVLGASKATHKVSSNSNTLSADQDGDGFFASILGSQSE
jgi:hypothetical protein